ncbi:MAG: L,D-transpeptidase family protein [Paracoccus sp. (in: a-proteobacteria)]|nr:L,D-transpeptidase family protein [Paracoccus sp. (in: a-proteobacteria)]
MNEFANHLRRFALIGICAAGLPAMGAALPAPKLEFTPFEMELARSVAADPGLAAFYGAHDLRPVFAGSEGAPRRAALLDAIATAPRHGLPPARYDTAGLGQGGEPGDVATELRYARALSRWAGDVSNGLVNPARSDEMNKRDVIPVDMAALLGDMVSGDPVAALAALPPDDAAYLQLMDMLAGQAALIAPPGTPEVAPGLYRIGTSGPAVADLRARLAAIGFAPTAGAGDPQVFDEDTADAVRRYQEAAGLPVDGVAGPKTIGQLNGRDAGPQTRALMIAMERLRWLNGHDLNDRMIWVNIPAYTAEIRENGQTVFETRAVMGTPDPQMQTPEFSDTMAFVVPNPTWTVPPGMARRTYLPRLAQNPNAYGHLDVVDARGRVIPRAQVNFAAYVNGGFPYALRQKPSPNNALGRVKFMFPNEWNIYLHDTPARHLFNNRVRADSNGCVRIGDPLDLAYQLLRGNSDDPKALFQRVLATGEERWIRMEEPLPIHLVYFTTIPGPDGRLRSYADIYGRDARLWAAMQKAAGAGS